MNQADTAWMLISTALVLLMTPALAFFYGGLVRSKNALNTMMMSFISLGFVGVLWAVIGYSLAFAPGNSLIGDTSRLFLRGVGLEAQGTIPHLLFMCYQGTFAIITAALISGAIVERMRFSAMSPSFRCGWSSFTPRSRIGSGAGDGSRRWAPSTLPAGPSSTSMRGSRRSSRRCASASAATTSSRRSCRTTYRSCCSAAGCCGLGGSASMPAARSAPVPRRRWRSRRPCWRRPRRWSYGRCSMRCVRASRRPWAGRRPSWWALSRSRRRPVSSAP